jgi:hypothetical protein
LIIRITYADALSKEETNDLIKKNEETVRLTSDALTNVYLVNIFPIRPLISMLAKPFVHLPLPVKHIPAWVPGAGFQRLAAHVKELNHTIRNGPWEKVLKDIVRRSCYGLYRSQTCVGLWDPSSQPGRQID